MKLTIKELKKVVSDALNEIDQQYYDELFDTQRYDTIARQLVNKHPTEYSKKNWRRIINDYASTRKEVSGRSLDLKLLFSAVSEMVKRDHDLKSQHTQNVPKLIPEKPIA